MSPPSSPSPPPTLLSSSLTSTTYSILLQLLSRSLTFALNQVLLRFTTPEVLGTASIQLDLLLNTVFFLSREGVRGAVLRSAPSSSSSSKESTHNLLFLPLPLGMLLSALLIPLYLNTLPSAPPPGLYTAVALYALAILLELLAEPLKVRTLAALDYKLRASVEGTAIVLKTLATLGALWVGGAWGGVVAYGVGQAVYSGTLLVRYGWVWARREGRWRRLLPRRIEGQPAFPPTQLRLAWALTLQSSVKQFLTEGDKLIVSRLSTLSDQGGYAIADNYGSLLARILFQPLEESSRIYFSRSPSSPTTHLPLLHLLLHTQALALLLAPALLSPYTTPLLRLIAPRFAHTSAPLLLRTYTLHLPIMFLNGTSEAYLQSTASPPQLARASKALLLWSAVFAGTAYVLRTDPSGVLLASSVNLACRAAYSIAYIARRFPSILSWREVGVHPAVVVVAALGAWAVRWSEGRYEAVGAGAGRALLEHVGVGAVAGLVCLGTIALCEGRWYMRKVALLKASASDKRTE